MDALENLRKEVESNCSRDKDRITDYYIYQGLKEHYSDTPIIAKAYSTAYLFKHCKKVIYKNDLILGSISGCFSSEISPVLLSKSRKMRENYGKHTFITGYDHFAPDYNYVLEKGIGGILYDIKVSTKDKDEKSKEFLKACEICMSGLCDMILDYAKTAKSMGKQKEAEICENISLNTPKTFREALQLVWMVHLSFVCEDRFAMALGRMDQYLYPYYKKDIENGIITKSEATELLSSTLYKINEFMLYTGNWDVINICIGGVDRNGNSSINELSYCLLDAVKACNICGPNLSARISSNTPDDFWDKCLEVIGTGIGYPALMSDDQNITALRSFGYPIEDCRDYCMVGCIENFFAGKQPPWTDGRYNTPMYLEHTLNNGRYQGFSVGPKTGEAEDISSMEQFIKAYEKQLEFAAEEYVIKQCNEYNRYNKEMYAQPYISCFCRECIMRGKDIGDGGSLYPSNHGVGCMGIATVSDSLAAIEQVVFIDKTITLTQLRDILNSNFKGHEDIRRIMRGMDTRGITSMIHSVTKPDYSKVPCGTVVNVKLSPSMFTDLNNRVKLRELFKIYFAKGGQEIQTNCISRDTLLDAQKNPEKYRDLVVRVSGFSAIYTMLTPEVQKDILMRTEYE